MTPGRKAVQYTLPPATSKARSDGLSNPVTRSSIWDPSRLARWMTSGPKAVQYILPPATSKARSAGSSNPVMGVSILEPSKSARYMIPISISLSVQYILPPATSKARPNGLNNPATRTLILEPSKSSRRMTPVPQSDHSIQYIFGICDTITRTAPEQLLLVLLSPTTLCTQIP